MLPLAYNFLVSFPAVNWPDESGLHACPAHWRDVRVVHWPGDAWKPWQRCGPAHADPRSRFDALWWRHRALAERVLA